MDTYINIKVYSDDKELANKALKMQMRSLVIMINWPDRYKAYDGIINVNYINKHLGC